MERTLPVARRTRRREAEMFRELHESIKKQRSILEQIGTLGLDSNNIVLDDSDKAVAFLDDKDVVVETECITIEDSDDEKDSDSGEEDVVVETECITIEDSDEKDSDSSEDDDGDDDDDDGSNEEDHEDEDYDGGSISRAIKSVGSYSRLKDKEPNKRKYVTASREYEHMEILAQSMWHKAELTLQEGKNSENLMLLEEGDRPVLNEKTILPSKFTFGGVELSQPEKTGEYEELWADLNIIIYGSNDDSAAGRSVINDVDSPSPCRKGDHFYILDEEIGLVCKYCSHVHLEIKYYVEAFADNPYRRVPNKAYEMIEQDVSSQLQHHSSDPGCGSCTLRPGTVWSLIPEIAKGMYDHQREGFEFLWKNIAGGIDLNKLKDTSSTGGNGCIISHAPGTGKTLVAIAFIQTYMEVFPACRPLIVAPCSMLHIWQKEFDKWNVKFPFHNLKKKELSGKEDKDASSKVMSGKPNHIRMVKVHSWMKERSILGISYKLFEKLVAEDEQKKAGSSNKNKMVLRNVLLNIPGLLVLDEGHTPRNNNSVLWKAFEKVKTANRIILSGTPFQNNFDELFNTLSLVNPNFLDGRVPRQYGTTSRRRRRGSKARQYWSYLTSHIGKTGDDRLKIQKLREVREIIRPFVHVYEKGVIQEKINGLRESVLLLEPVPSQKTIIDAVQQTNHVKSLSLGHWISGVAVHPSLLSKESFPAGENVINWTRLKRMKLDTDAGVKSKFLIELIRLSVARNEKVLVFSQYINTLKLVSDQIKSKFHWKLGDDFLYIDGKLVVETRKKYMDTFNKKDSRAKVMLASIKACCEGISLVGASRVVLLDVVWNPSIRTQAISRAYRLEQEKTVHVYHLIASGTMEEEKFCRQVKKEKLSEMVFRPADRSSSRPLISADDNNSNDDMILQLMLDRNGDMFKTIYEHTDTDDVQILC